MLTYYVAASAPSILGQPPSFVVGGPREAVFDTNLARERLGQSREERKKARRGQVPASGEAG